MTRARRPLAEAAADPTFTPRRSDVPALLGILAEAAPELAGACEAAILRVGAPAIPTIEARLVDAVPPLRGRLVRLLGRLAYETGTTEAAGGPGEAAPELLPRILGLLGDADPKSRRNAIIAAGKLGPLDPPRVAGALLARAAAETSIPHLRSFAAAIGKVGGPAGLAWLRGLDDRGDPELARIRAQALLIAERSQQRAQATSTIAGDRPPPRSIELHLHVRRGLEGLLVDELAARGLGEGAAIAPGVVAVRGRRPLAAWMTCRLALEVALPLRLPPGRASLAAAVVDACTEGHVPEILSHWTEGPIRYRLALAGGGRRRAEVWAIARALSERCPALVNDPTATTWELRVDPRAGLVLVIPRRLCDPRFAYRRGDVPAASHPTIAAALARISEPRADDVVWDPFVGSGLELCERVLLGPYAALHGSDVDPRALAIAGENLRAAGTERWTLAEADALVHAIAGGVTCVLTNPPLGRRVHRGAAQGLLGAFLGRIGEVLRPRGRLCWITPEPAATGPLAAAAGLRREVALTVDLGGFAGTIERWRRG